MPSPLLRYLCYLPAGPRDGLQASVPVYNEPLVWEDISGSNPQFSPEPERAPRRRDVSPRSQRGFAPEPVKVAGVRGLPSVSAAAGSAPEPVGALLGHGILAQAQRAVAPEPVRALGVMGFQRKLSEW